MRSRLPRSSSTCSAAPCHHPSSCMGIVGAGIMGSLALKMALRLGVREVLVEDVNDSCSAAARQMGATLAEASALIEAVTAQLRQQPRHLVLPTQPGEPAARQRAFFIFVRPPGGTVVLLVTASVARNQLRRQYPQYIAWSCSFGHTPEFKRSRRQPPCRRRNRHESWTPNARSNKASTLSRR